MNAVAQLPIPPALANVETEAALCSAMLAVNEVIDPVADLVSADDFTDDFYRFLFTVILAEHCAGRGVSAVSIKGHFTPDSYPVLAELGRISAAPIGARDFALQIADLAKRRRLIEGLNGVIAEAQRLDTSASELVEAADTAMAELQEGRTGLKEISAADALKALVDSFGQAQEPGVTCGLTALDDALGPVKPSQLVIVAGRPGMGKTSCALSYALGAARKGHGVLFISLEMSEEELTARMAADLCFDGRTGIPFAAIESRRVTNEQARQVARATSDAEHLPFEIVDAGSLKIGTVNSLIRRYARKFAARKQRLELVVVDYLQLVYPDQREKDLYTRVTEVSKGLKAAAKSNRVGIMALAQLSRDVEKRGGDHRPKLADLRDSGQIEQDADGIMFLFRPEYYLLAEQPPETDPRYPEWQGKYEQLRFVLEFIVAKRRNRPTRATRGQFFGAFQAVRG